MGDLHHIETPKPDAELAKDYRNEIMPLIEKVVAVMTRARRDGLVINFNLGADQNGRVQAVNFDIIKSLL